MRIARDRVPEFVDGTGGRPKGAGWRKPISELRLNIFAKTALKDVQKIHVMMCMTQRLLQ